MKTYLKDIWKDLSIGDAFLLAGDTNVGTDEIANRMNYKISEIEFLTYNISKDTAHTYTAHHFDRSHILDYTESHLGGVILPTGMVMPPATFCNNATCPIVGFKINHTCGAEKI